MNFATKGTVFFATPRRCFASGLSRAQQNSHADHDRAAKIYCTHNPPMFSRKMMELIKPVAC
jgi:hypothetical protein